MARRKKETPAWLLALGRNEPPPTLRIGEVEYRYEHTFKHDFFACTSLYAGASDKVVLKINRCTSVFGFPLTWLGRLLARREAAFFRLLDGLDIVPAFTGRHGPTGVTHAYVEGRPFARTASVPDDFFDLLEAGLADIHARGVAYADLEKAGNVLLGEDGRPYLFDFQISWYWSPRFGGNLWPLSSIRSLIQWSDVYHARKHKKLTRPDLMTDDAFYYAAQKPWFVRLHGAIVQPLQRLRRGLLKRLDPDREHHGERGMLEPAKASERPEPDSADRGAVPETSYEPARPPAGP